LSKAFQSDLFEYGFEIYAFHSLSDFRGIDSILFLFRGEDKPASLAYYGILQRLTHSWSSYSPGLWFLPFSDIVFKYSLSLDVHVSCIAVVILSLRLIIFYLQRANFNMVKFYDSIPDDLREWVSSFTPPSLPLAIRLTSSKGLQQSVFFTASAPLTGRRT